MNAAALKMPENILAAAESANYTADKMSHIERRAMKLDALAHEICRLIMQTLFDWDWKGDATWVVRQVRDLATHWVRCMCER